MDILTRHIFISWHEVFYETNFSARQNGCYTLLYFFYGGPFHIPLAIILPHKIIYLFNMGAWSKRVQIINKDKDDDDFLDYIHGVSTRSY
jgi:hypothetical protein